MNVRRYPDDRIREKDLAEDDTRPRLGSRIIAIPLAAGLIYPSFILSPAMGALLMSLSTIRSYKCRVVEVLMIMNDSSNE